MPTQMIIKNPLRMYLAALLPLCRKRIMNGKLQRDYQDFVHYIEIARKASGGAMRFAQGSRAEGTAGWSRPFIFRPAVKLPKKPASAAEVPNWDVPNPSAATSCSLLAPIWRLAASRWKCRLTLS